MPTVRILVDSLDVQQDRRQLVADTLQELGYLMSKLERRWVLSPRRSFKMSESKEQD